MRIVSPPALWKFCDTHPQGAEARGPLRAWYADTKAAQWKSPADVTADRGTASILKGGRVVFNIAGNEFRLVVAIHYNTGIVFIRFVGTLKEYDRIDAQTV